MSIVSLYLESSERIRPVRRNAMRDENSESGAAAATPDEEHVRLGRARRVEARRQCRVLVVDDDDLVRSRLCSLLTAAHYEVEEAASVDEALRVLGRVPCHIVLTDWQMPDVDGLALCRQIRRARSDRYVYVMLLSVRGSARDVLEGLAAGADDYLVKGASVQEILARLQTGRRISQGAAEQRTRYRDAPSFVFTDPVTGAHNLAYLLEHLPREIARAERHGHPLAVLSCRIEDVDADAAAAVGPGADLLRAFVTRCEDALRAGDWLARTGGAEFLVVLPETTGKGALSVARKLRKTFALQSLQVHMAVTATEAKYDLANSLKMQALLQSAERGAGSDPTRPVRLRRLH
jgi:diguanylate cyclase (GGDEF)-like protein